MREYIDISLRRTWIYILLQRLVWDYEAIISSAYSVRIINLDKSKLTIMSRLQGSMQQPLKIYFWYIVEEKIHLLCTPFKIIDRSLSTGRYGTHGVLVISCLTVTKMELVESKSIRLRNLFGRTAPMNYLRYESANIIT